MEVLPVGWCAGADLAAARDQQRHTPPSMVPVPGAQFLVEARADPQAGGRVVFTDPQVAAVGLTEAETRDRVSPSTSVSLARTSKSVAGAA